MLQDIEELLSPFIGLYSFPLQQDSCCWDFDPQLFYQFSDLFYALEHLFTEPAYQFSEFFDI